MRKLKRINVPNIQEQLSQSNENRAINKKKLRRFIFMFIFIAAATLYVQFILTKQQEIIVKMKSWSCFYTYGIYTKINVVKILLIVL